jgi:hypothetical protein
VVPSQPTDPPIACQLKALDAEQRQRQKELLGVVRGKIQQTLELPDGFALQMPNDHVTFMEVAEWVSLERRCCAFAEFLLEMRGDDTVWVTVTGGSGAKEVLAAEMGIDARKGPQEGRES